MGGERMSPAAPSSKKRQLSLGGDDEDSNKLDAGDAPPTYDEFRQEKETVLRPRELEVKLVDPAGMPLPPPGIVASVDKGWTYDVEKQCLVCHRKNHLQITVGVTLGTMYDELVFPAGMIRDGDHVIIESTRVNVYAIKAESPLEEVAFEMADMSRKKHPFVPADFPALTRRLQAEMDDAAAPAPAPSRKKRRVGDEAPLPMPDGAVVTVLKRLHFGTCTIGNSRLASGRDQQRYFRLRIAIEAMFSDGSTAVIAEVESSDVVVRASNPASFAKPPSPRRTKNTAGAAPSVGSQQPLEPDNHLPSYEEYLWE